MAIRDDPDFGEKLERLTSLLAMREEPRTEIDQRYLTLDSIIERVNVLDGRDQLEGKRILTIGDADLTGLAIALFGNPQEVVVADIDDRLSEIYFEATLEYGLPVRFVYHDMRIKVIAILKKQYSLVLMEPPRTVQAMKVFLSRSMEILEPGDNNNVFISLPDNLVPEFKTFIEKFNIKIIESYDKINHYLDGSSPTNYLELEFPNDIEPNLKNHHIHPFYEHEVSQDLYEYKCICRVSYTVGEGGDFATYDELKHTGCNECDYQGVFAYKSDIQLK